MRTFKFTKSKEIKNAYKNHQNSVKFELKDCYKNPSYNKLLTYEELRGYCRNLNGFDLRIISHNSFTYTAGFFGYYNETLNFFYVTADKIRYTTLDNLI